MTIGFGLSPVVFELGIYIFPVNISEQLSRGGRVGNNAGSEQVGDRGVAEVALPVTPVVVAHNGVGRGVKGDGVVFAVARRGDFRRIARDLDPAVGETPEGFVDLDLGWEFPGGHKVKYNTVIWRSGSAATAHAWKACERKLSRVRVPPPPQMNKVLIYAFSSWGENAGNISEKVLGKLNLQVDKRVLRVRFENEPYQQMVTGQYDLIVGLGQYPRGCSVRIEQYAYNLFGSRGQGYKPIVPGGPEKVALDAHTPMVEGAVLSEDPGRFVCNYSMYQIMQHKGKETKFGFIHIPKGLKLNRAAEIVRAILTKSGVE